MSKPTPIVPNDLVSVLIREEDLDDILRDNGIPNRQSVFGAFRDAVKVIYPDAKCAVGIADWGTEDITFAYTMDGHEVNLGPILDVIKSTTTQPTQGIRTMKFSTMLPTHYNDGSPIDSVTFESVVRMLWSEYGGCTVDAVADGYWFCKEEDKLYKEPVRRVTVFAEGDSEAVVDFARSIIRRIGVLLCQKVMLFEHDGYGLGTVEFLDTENVDSLDA